MTSKPTVARTKAPTEAETHAVMKAIDEAEPQVIPSLVFGKAGGGRIESTDFVLTDEQGRTRGRFSTTADNEPGLALFEADNAHHARLEMLLEATGPCVKLNTPKGWPRILLKVSDMDVPSVTLFTRARRAALIIALDGGRPRVLFAGRRRWKRPVMETQSAVAKRHWPRVLRAVRANNRSAFDRAILDAGFWSTSLDSMWAWSRARNAEEGPTTTPEDTLRDAGVTTRRQARYQRRMSSLLGRGARDGR